MALESPKITRGNAMRLILAAAFAAFAFSSAQAAEITVLAPGFVKFAGIDDLAEAYTKETGIKVTVKSTGMGAMMDTIKTGTPAADVVMLPQNLMDQLQAQKGVVAGSRKVLGRVQIVMIVPAGAPHPDISTHAKLAAALHGATHVAYSSPWKAEKSAQAMIIHDILQRPEFAGTHESLVGPLPADLHAWLDGDVAISSRTADAKAAADFLAYITRPAATPVWKAK